MVENVLYYGDNLDILRRYIKDEKVDLIYLDPPFKSEQDYNVLFAERNGSRSAAQIKVFEDTWRWDEASAKAYHEIVENGPAKVSQVMRGFRTFLGENDIMAYLAMMAPRLAELHRALKPTGSIYLHCDPTASHYLKTLMDAVFGPTNFRNEIVWHYSGWNKKMKYHFERRHDILLLYAKGRKQLFKSYSLPWKDIDEYVRIRKQKLRYDNDGKAYVLSDAGAGKRVKRYIEDAMAMGRPVDDLWEIDKLTSSSKERLGYPTQKPEALLERIIIASSKEGEIVLDPFCGCGTTIAVAQRLNRHWIGIDVTHLAVTLIKHRLKDMFGNKIQYQAIGEPVSLPDAKTLAENDPYQFQWWALGLVGARPVEQKKGADRGIDGRLYFHDEADSAKARTKQIIISVKSGHVSVADLRDLRGVVEREKAQIGVLICMEKPTKPMRTEAASAGFYKSPWGTSHPVLQILTIKELLDGKQIDYPHSEGVNVTFNKAQKVKSGTTVTQAHLFHKERKQPAEN